MPASLPFGLDSHRSPCTLSALRNGMGMRVRSRLTVAGPADPQAGGRLPKNSIWRKTTIRATRVTRSSWGDLLEGWCAGGRFAGRRAGQEEPIRLGSLIGGNHHEERGDWLRLKHLAEVYRTPRKDLPILVQNSGVDLVVRMFDRIQTTRFGEFVTLRLVRVGIAFMCPRVQHWNPDREEVREQGDGYE